MRMLALILMLGALVPGAPAAAHSSLKPEQLADLSFRQHPGAALPVNTPLLDEDGRPVRLGDYFAGRPVILVLDYLRCRTLCGFVLNNLATTLAHVPLAPGKDFAVVAVSIDPRDTPADSRAARAKYLQRYGNASAAGWHFLTGEESAVRRIADAIGFPYRYDAAAEQFAHPAGFVVAAPDATVARYILGVDYVPLDLRLALTEAGRGKISSPVADLLLLCYCYDPATGRYSATINDAMRVAGGATVLGIAGMIVLLSRRKAG